MPSNYLILCRPLLFLTSILPSIRVFSNVSALHIRWPKYWSFSFSISLSSEHPGLISFRMDWLDLLAVQLQTRVLNLFRFSWWPIYFHFEYSSLSFWWKKKKSGRHELLLLFFFGCARSFLLLRFFSSCSKLRLLSRCSAWASPCRGFSCCRAQAVSSGASVAAARGFSGCGSWAPEHRLSSCGTSAQLLCGMWDLPGSGTEPMSPTLTARSFTTELPGKLWMLFWLIFFSALAAFAYSTPTLCRGMIR